MPKEKRIKARKQKIDIDKKKDEKQPETNGETVDPKSSGSASIDELRRHVNRYHCSEAQVASLLKLLVPYIPDLQKENPKDFRKNTKVVKPKKSDE